MTAGLAVRLYEDLGAEWHEHAYALAAFKAGLLALLAQYKPEGDASVRPKVAEASASLMTRRRLSGECMRRRFGTSLRREGRASVAIAIGSEKTVTSQMNGCKMPE